MGKGREKRRRREKKRARNESARKPAIKLERRRRDLSKNSISGDPRDVRESFPLSDSDS